MTENIRLSSKGMGDEGGWVILEVGVKFNRNPIIIECFRPTAGGWGGGTILGAGDPYTLTGRGQKPQVQKPHGQKPHG